MTLSSREAEEAIIVGAKLSERFLLQLKGLRKIRSASRWNKIVEEEGREREVEAEKRTRAAMAETEVAILKLVKIE